MPELISHLLWLVAAVITAYCLCGWIGAVTRRKGQCWAKHQRYSQNALCLPHTLTLFHLFINTSSGCRFKPRSRSLLLTLHTFERTLTKHFQGCSGVYRQIMKWSRPIMCLGFTAGIPQLNLKSTHLQTLVWSAITLMWVLRELFSVVTFTAGAACDGG